MFKKWTIQRASGIGSVAGLIAVVLWPIFAAWPELFRWPFILALAVAVGCGASMLWITLRDIFRNPGRGSRLRPIRTFDIALGLILTIPTIAELRVLLP